jgi:cytoskeletal protein CcmA (bactofilin family)
MPEPESRNVATICGAVRIVGQIFAKEDIYLDGDVVGRIESPDSTITIGPNGRVQADIRACEVVILGSVRGNVDARNRVGLRKDSTLVGDITTLRISMEEGAIFKGRIDTGKPEPRPLAMLDYRSLSQRGLGPGRLPKRGAVFVFKDSRLDDSVLIPENPQNQTASELQFQDTPVKHSAADLEAAGEIEEAPEQEERGFETAPGSAAPDAALREPPRTWRPGIPVCPVCGRKRPRVRVGSVGSRLVSRCRRCDLLTIADPLKEWDSAAEAEHLRHSIKSFWFHFQCRLRELGHRGPVGYSGPEEYLGPIARAARDFAMVVPLEDLARHTTPGRCPAILLFHALESEPDPEAFLAKCHRLVAPNGRLFVAASNPRSLHCLLWPSSWNGFQLKAQLFCYNSKTLSRLLRVAGFQVARRVKSGLEAFGSSLDGDILVQSNRESRYWGFLKRCFQTIICGGNAFHSFGSVLYLEAVPSANPRRKHASATPSFRRGQFSPRPDTTLKRERELWKT